MSHSTLNHLGQPIGLALEGWAALPLPSRRALEGRYCRVEPQVALLRGRCKLV